MNKRCEGCKEKAGCNCRTHTYEQDQYFFKVMIGNFRERLTIPPKFELLLRGKFPRNIKLESCHGHPFDVQVTKIFDRVVLQSGWKAFVCAHDLKMGDFLVFKYDVIDQLKVLIFENTGCEKALPSLAMKNASLCGKWREDYIDIASSYDLPVRSLQSEPETWNEKESSSHANTVVTISSSISPSGSSGDAAHCVPRYILPQGINLSGVQRQMLKEKVRAINSEIPIYGFLIRKSHVHGKPSTVDISRKYAEAYLSFNERTLTLERHGKKWAVRCKLQMSTTQRLLNGWEEFAHDNKLQMGDICLFERLKNKNYTMNVHIIHKK